MNENQPKIRQMARERHKIDRQRARRSTLPTALIVCEGEKSEPNYIEGLVRHHRINSANVRIIRGDGTTDPVGVVGRAHELFGRNNDFDRVFAVVDGDQANLDNARNLARKRLISASGKSLGLELIVSHPCFELWLLLHLTYTDQPFQTCEEVVQALRREIPGYEKANRDLLHGLYDRLEVAIRNAIRLDEANRRSGSKDTSTNMTALVDALKAMVPELV